MLVNYFTEDGLIKNTGISKEYWDFVIFKELVDNALDAIEPIADTKIYKITDIDFRNMAIEADETDLSIADVPKNETFPIEEFGEFRIRLYNG